MVKIIESNPRGGGGMITESSIQPRMTGSRLNELRSLKDGWLEGHGKAPSHDGLDWLADSFNRHYPDDLSLPFFYPTEGGGVQAEWSLSPYEITLEIDLADRFGQWHCLNMANDAEESEPLDLAFSGSWEWLIGRLRQMTGGAG